MPDVIKIVEENFKNIAPSLLLDPKWYQDVEDMVVSIDATTDPDYAKQYALLLAEKLESLGDSISPELFARYTKLLRALRFYSLLAVSDGEKEKFVREQILDVFELEFINVRHWVETMLCAYLEAPDVIDQLRKIFQRGLESNIQTLGTGRLRLAGEQNSVAPTIKNWVSDYNHTARIDELRKSRGSFEEFNYVNQSANAKTLDPKDRKVLQKFLAIYDWLRFAAIKCDYSFPGQKPIPGSDKILEEARYDLIPQEAVDSLKASAAVSPTYLREERITVPVPGTARPPIRPQPHPVAPTPFAPAMPRPAVSPQPSKILPPPPLPPRKVMEGAAPQAGIRKQESPVVAPTLPRDTTGQVRIKEEEKKEIPGRIIEERPLSWLPSRTGERGAVVPPSVPKPIAKILSQRPVEPPVPQKVQLPKELAGELALKPKPEYVRRTTPLNEDLYRSTLEQLSEMRKADEVLRPEVVERQLEDAELEREIEQKLSKMPEEPKKAEPGSGRLSQYPAKEPQQPPSPVKPPEKPSLAVNEALITAGQAPAPSEQDKKLVEEKLKQLQKKVSEEQKKPDSL
jgi:hypothetical protein